MIVPAAVRHKHDTVLPYINQASIRVKDIVLTYCERQGFAYVGRLKETESLAEKIETGRFKTWSSLDDLFACCVVIPTPGDEDDVLAHLRASFVEVTCRSRATSAKDPSVFRFDATRFVGRLKPDSVPAASDDLLSVNFEIQVRTAFEHAWSVTTHALAYKSSTVDWRHLRLAAQLRASVEQLDQVVSGFEQTAGFIAEQDWPEVQAKKLIREYFQGEVSNGRVPSESAPASWGRFCENLHALILCYSKISFSTHVSTVQAAISKIDVEVKSMGGAIFPRSISLFQFCVGALAKGGFFVGTPPRKPPVLVCTSELVALYPAVTDIGIAFDFNQ